MKSPKIISGTMKSARLLSPGQYAITEADIPVPLDDEVLIRNEACGVCMSEKGNWNGRSGMEYPLDIGMTGHEPYGTVVGGASDDFPLGSLVTSIMSSPNAYAEYVVAKKSATAIVPEPFDDQILLGEPLACAVNAVKRCPMKPGDSIAVLGAGYMGLLLLSVLRQSSPAPIVVFDIKEDNLRLAEKAGADLTVNPSNPEPVQKALDLVGTGGFDIVYEAAGMQSTIDLATSLVKIRGTIVIYGYHSIGLRQVNMQQWNWKGLNIINAHERDIDEYADGMNRGLRLFDSRGSLPDYITHKTPLENINDAFRMLEDRPSNYIKGVIVFDDRE